MGPPASSPRVEIILLLRPLAYWTLPPVLPFVTRPRDSPVTALTQSPSVSGAPSIQYSPIPPPRIDPVLLRHLLTDHIPFAASVAVRAADHYPPCVSHRRVYSYLSCQLLRSGFKPEPPTKFIVPPETNWEYKNLRKTPPGLYWPGETPKGGTPFGETPQQFKRENNFPAKGNVSHHLSKKSCNLTRDNPPGSQDNP